MPKKRYKISHLYNFYFYEKQINKYKKRSF